MSLSYHTDRAIASENAHPQGLPSDTLSNMEADILANPDKYPAITAIFKKMDAEKASNEMREV